MKYLFIFLLLLTAVNPLSYAKYNWSRKNKLGAIGVILLALAAVIIPSVLLFLRELG